MKAMNALILAVNAVLAVTTASHAQPNFTKITTGPIISDHASSTAAAWADIYGDGALDLFVSSSDSPNLLYRNDGHGGFTKITSGPIVNAGPNSWAASWVDMNNDGFLDLYTAKEGGPSLLFLQQADGSFTQQTYPMATLSGAAWGDYDEDGFVDFLGADSSAGMLWHNNGQGGLEVVPGTPINLSGIGATTWADYEGTGHLAAFVEAGPFAGGTISGLYRSDGHGVFTSIANALTEQNIPFSAAAWGDYDNNGLLDVFLPRTDPSQPVAAFLFHNDGNGNFSKVDQPPFTTDTGDSGSCSWADYDNDGWLDLFVSDWSGGHNRLYHNNGDGTFTRVLSGPIVSDGGTSQGSAWGDYDRNGFLDLFVATSGSGNYLYHNDGNSNAWIEVKCVGTRSNRSAIGAKVRVKATIGGKTFWQLREISTGNGWCQNAMEAHFGLGNATNVETLRIEWPSGTVQEFQTVAGRQYLTVTEPSQMVPGPSNGTPQFTLCGGRNMRYDIQTSTNLADWSLLNTITITNLDGKALMANSSLQAGSCYYRAVLR